MSFASIIHIWALVSMVVMVDCREDKFGLSVWREIQSRPELNQFATWVTTSGKQYQFDSNALYTVFAPNNTAFKMIPKVRFDLLKMSIGEYVDAYTISNIKMLSSSMHHNTEKTSYRNTRLYFARPKERSGERNIYVNGALIYSKDIPCSNGLIHIVGQLTDLPSIKTIYQYIENPDLTFLKFSMFMKLLNRINKEKQQLFITKLKSIDTAKTLFIPSDDALKLMPNDKYLQLLNGKKDTLEAVLFSHLISGSAVMTSWVPHNYGVRNANPNNLENISFRKLERLGVQKVYIHSRGVSAEVMHGNITVNDGVIHVVDRILGHTYYTTREEIEYDGRFRSSIFHKFLVQDVVSIKNHFASKLKTRTIFVPTDEAFRNAEKYSPWFDPNDRGQQENILQLHIVPGLSFQALLESREFIYRQSLETLYRQQKLDVYSRYDITFVEGGYVRARIVGPDFGVTDGYVHYIDRVLGVPIRDMLGTMCEDDWLRTPYHRLSQLNLGAMFVDCRLINTNQPCVSMYNFDQSTGSNNGIIQTHGVSACDKREQVESYTFFIPNGTALEFFESQRTNRPIHGNKDIYRKVFRRHMVSGKIFLRQMEDDEQILKTMTDETVIVKRNRITRNDQFEIQYKGQRAEVLHADLLATNGIVHIINKIFVSDDDITTGTNRITTSYISVTLTLLINFLFKL